MEEKTPLILWTDIETNGLELAEHKILEVACVLTDTDLREISRIERLVTPNYVGPEFKTRKDRCEFAREKANPFVRDMHEKNGLWEALFEGGQDSVEAEGDIAQWLVACLEEHGNKLENGTLDAPLIGGASVHFDRKFLDYNMPKITNLCHYRMVDVSTLKRQCEWWLPSYVALDPGSEAEHRAMSDILFTIKEAAAIKALVQKNV